MSDSRAAPGVGKIAFGVAAGIILAGVLVVFVLTGIGAAAQRGDDEAMRADRLAIADCRSMAARLGTSVDDVHERLRPCLAAEDDFRVRWRREP